MANSLYDIFGLTIGQASRPAIRRPQVRAEARTHFRRPVGRRTERRENHPPVWPCEPLCALFPERAAAMRTPTLLERVWASFWEFAEDERKSRRKNRRFCGAGSLTTARSAGSCGVLKGRSSACEIKAMTLFSAKFGCLLRAARTIRGVPGLLNDLSTNKLAELAGPKRKIRPAPSTANLLLF